MRKLTLERKIVIFKTIAILKIVLLLFITTVPKDILKELEKCKRLFSGKSLLLKHENLCNDYKAAGLKNVDILNKLIAPQCS